MQVSFILLIFANKTILLNRQSISFNNKLMKTKMIFATVRTRADGTEVSASTVFAEVDKKNCILYVPLNSADKYRAITTLTTQKNELTRMDKAK